MEKLTMNMVKLILLIWSEHRCRNITNLRGKLWLKETWEDTAKVELIMQCSGETILIKSSKEYHTGRVKLLLSSPYLDVNQGTEDGITALHIAAIMENIDVIKLLLNHPRLNPNEVNNDYMTALMEASRGGKFEVVKLLLRHQPC